MLRINGEITTFLSDCNFKDKDELMEKLRALRKSPNLKDDCKYEPFYEMIGVAIQQAFYVNEKQLMRYKGYCNYRSENGGNNEKQIN